MKKTDKSAPAESDILFSWKCKSFLEYEHGLWWYFILFFLAAGLISYAILVEKSWSMASVVTVLAIVILLSSRKEASELSAYICKKYIFFRGERLPYVGMASFWFVEKEDFQSLNLEIIGVFKKTITIPMEKADIPQIRKLLSKHLPENRKKEEPFADSLGRKLKI